MKRLLLAALLALGTALPAARAEGAAPGPDPIQSVLEDLGQPDGMIELGGDVWMLYEVPGPLLEALGREELAIPVSDLDASTALHVDPAVDKVESEWLSDGVTFRVTTYKQPKESDHEYLMRHKTRVAKAKIFFPPDPAE